jgi:hypothetical protein
MLKFLPNPMDLRSDLTRRGVRIDGEVQAALDRYQLALGRMAFLQMDAMSQSMCGPDQSCSIPDDELQATAAAAIAYIKDVLALQQARGIQ